VLVASFLVLLACQAQDPVRVRAQLNDAEVQVGRVATFRVEVETDGPRAQIRPFATLPPGLELAGTRDSDHRQFSMPGGMRRFITREFSLRATEPGRYEIPAVTVVVEGATYATEPALLTVTAGPAAGPGGVILGADDVVLRATVDADTIYVGQQVTLRVDAMFSHDARLRLRRAPEYQAPTVSGFWVHDLPDPRTPTHRGVRGDVFEVQTFRRALFPMSPGHYQIPPALLFYEMRRGILQAPETFTVESEPVPLVVLPVPAADAPPGFTGAVGRYTLRGWIEPSRVAAGDATILTVELEGVGNVRALPPPSLGEIQGVEVFPPTEESQLEISGNTLHGTKRFSWMLVPRDEGSVTLPEIAYAFFDPERRAFVRATVALPPLAVERGGGRADPATAAATIRYLQTRPRPGTGLAWVDSPWFAAAHLAPLILLAGAMVLRRRERRAGTGRPSAFALRRQRRRAIRQLEDAVRRKDPDFFALADATARSWVAARLGVEPGAADRVETLTSAGVTHQTATSFRAVMDRIAAGRYAPGPQDPAMQRQIVDLLDRGLARIDAEARRQAGPRAGTTGRTAAAGLVALLALAGALPAGAGAATSTSTSTFQRGVELFDAREYGGAAEAFERYLESEPRDAAAWYNLGTAWYRAEQPGPAVWAWLHAVALDPRDRDAHHNLRVAAVTPELVARVTPPVPLRTVELRLLAALAWLAAAVAGAWWLLRRRTAAAAVALVSLVVALAAAGSAWHSTRGAETLILIEPAALRAGPSLHAEAVTSLASGTGLVPVDRHGDWVRARTLSGQEGWLESISARKVRTP
jgi:tetratricopeptide (TPR) repeat protein